ncbi:3D domain-containing protein [Lysinibacillus sp. NPDC093210]|uniref:3D domain-containing protein n=1 Tax=Lysinibacillus sp. NPDC093210 TaxID=3364133 RepID=UPI00382FF67A
MKNLGILMNVYKITFILLLLFILMNFTLEDKKLHKSSHNGEELLQNSPKIKLETSMKMIHSKAITLRQEKLQIEKEKQRLKQEAMIRKEKILLVEQSKNPSSKEKVQTISNQEKQKQNTKKWMKFNASYYGPDCKGCSGITVTGINVRETNYYNGLRIVAVDPSVLPLGTIVEIKTPYESFRAISADKGGAIKGYKLDILVESEEVATKYGRHNVQVRIIQYP